mmetsp:Transcript_16286/g.20893  ORF Transcript_16286/g.20893 Transcript_16286/m.20893 type:complete len:102 (-) Transcript_16286:463-768(-)
MSAQKGCRVGGGVGSSLGQASHDFGQSARTRLPRSESAAQKNTISTHNAASPLLYVRVLGTRSSQSEVGADVAGVGLYVGYFVGQSAGSTGWTLGDGAAPS